jgi:predicted secreted protein
MMRAWSGSMTFRADHDAAANQTLRAGDVFTFQGYTEGDAVGKTYYEGLVRITDHGISSPHDNAVERTYSFTGKGALTIDTVVL